ncbi:MAG: response regulator transcription factor, partial [Thermodesulfobacteriota bacterium]
PLRKGRMKIITSILTKREEQIVELVVREYNNRKIAKELTISLSTLKTHLGHIFKKLGIKTRSQLIAQFGGKVIPKK